MTALTTLTRDPADYLASVLPLNPIFQAEEILAARDRFLGRTPTLIAAEDAGLELLEQREELQAQVDSLREQFWKLDAKELRLALEGLKVDAFPDLKLAVDRLQYAFRVRRFFTEIEEHCDCYPELLQKLRNVAVASPRESGRIKQAFFLRATASRQVHKQCRSMIQMLRTEYSELYALEADWLEQIEQTKPLEGRTESEKEAERRRGGVSSGVGWAVALGLLSLIGRGLVKFDRISERQKKNSPPVVQQPLIPKPIQQQPPQSFNTPQLPSGNPDSPDSNQGYFRSMLDPSPSPGATGSSPKRQPGTGVNSFDPNEIQRRHQEQIDQARQRAQQGFPLPPPIPNLGQPRNGTSPSPTEPASPRQPFGR